MAIVLNMLCKLLDPFCNLKFVIKMLVTDARLFRKLKAKFFCDHD